MPRAPRPDFLVIGAPKAGTTALHAALAQHPDVFVSDPKEPKYWLCDGAPPPAWRGPGDKHSQQEWIWRADRYFPLFAPAAQHQARGESTPFYLWSRGAHRRIAEDLPDVRLVAVVRDPVDRAYSNWMHLWSDGLEPESDFVSAFGREDERVRAGWAPFWRYRELGRYGEQLAHLHRYVDPERILVIRYRDLVDAPGGDGRPGEPVPRDPGGPGRLDPARQLAQLRPAGLAAAAVRAGRARRRAARAVRAAAGVAGGPPAVARPAGRPPGRAPSPPRRDQPAAADRELRRRRRAARRAHRAGLRRLAQPGEPRLVRPALRDGDPPRRSATPTRWARSGRRTGRPAGSAHAGDEVVRAVGTRGLDVVAHPAVRQGHGGGVAEGAIGVRGGDRRLRGAGQGGAVPASPPRWSRTSWTRRPAGRRTAPCRRAAPR